MAIAVKRVPMLWILFCICSSGAAAQTSNPPEISAHETAPTYRIRVESNLVNVRVVVRDAQGRTVGNLEKKDFRLFDSGKPQEIVGFTVETASKKSGATEAASSSNVIPSTPAAVVPQRFIALFFDDLHTNTEETGRTRDAAWRYLSTAVGPEDRVALYTSSGKDEVDFTADRDKLHAALFRLSAHSRANPLLNQCPAIEEYQAYLIAQQQDTSALNIAVQEGYECNCRGINDTAECRDDQLRTARNEADQIWDLADLQSKYALDVLEDLVHRLAVMPGQRSVVLVSPGFLTMTRSDEINNMIERALQQSVVINAIDSAGLYARLARPRLAGSRLDLDALKTTLVNQGLEAQRDVLAGLSAATGGVYFRNSNDFDAGFRETAHLPEVTYVLSFSPPSAKLDGKFHPLKVTLANREHMSVQARRGYIAFQPTEAAATPSKAELEKIVFSLDELNGLPVAVTARAEKTGEQASTLAVRIHVDLRPLHFRKEADRSVDTLVFETALFDRDGKYVTGKAQSLDLRLTEATLAKLAQSGINAETKFRVAPGSYRVREVVRDTESKEISAMNITVQAPN
jgi:VWFA-related protein